MTSNILDLRGMYKEQYGFSTTTKSSFEMEKGLSEAVVKEISEMKKEPDWLRAFRLRALAHYMKRPMPKWGADLSEINFDEISYYVRPTDKPQAKSWDELPPEIKNTFDKLGIPEAERKFLAGVGAQFESENVYHSLQETLAKQGVVFVDPDTGLNPTEERIKQMGLSKAAIEAANAKFREWFGKVIPIEDNKFAALNSAVFSGGSFIYIPKNVHVALPLQAYFRINKENVGQFERTLIIADEGSKVHYIEGCTAPMYNEDKQSLHSAVVEIVALPHSTVRYTTLQNWSNNVYNLVTKRAWAFESATVEWLDANIGCLTGSTKIFLNSDVKEIKDIEPGDVVFALDENTNLVRRQVLGKKYSGRQKVYKIVSENYREIMATANHPFLTLTKTGKHLVLKWKRLDEVTENDLVALAGDIPDYGKPMKINYSKKTGTKDIRYPETTTDDFMWLLGFYIGDGYVHGSRVYFAVPEKDKSYGRVIEIVKNIFGLEKFEKRQNLIRYNSVDFLRFLQYLGLSGSAREKRVPKWIFTLPKDQRLAFIDGYVAADGHIRKGHKNISITSVNKLLLEDVKILAISCGLDARKVSKWTRREKKPLGKEEKEYTHYFLYFGERVFDNPLHFAKILSIEDSGEEDTYDIEIEGAHNFVANGFVVHNSRITMKYPSVFMLGPHAKADILSVAYAGKGQYQDAGGKAVHLAPYTTSKIISKSVSKDGGRSTYRGLLHIAKGATNAKSTVRCDALLLDETSRTDTYPYNEIKEDTATVTHEASVGKIGEDLIFYLMTRGLTEQQALGVIVNGFLEVFSKELPMEYAVEFNRLIQLEMSGSVG